MLTVAVALLIGRSQSSFPPYAVKPFTGVTISGLPEVTGHICVDQFGYLPDGKKVAVISDPMKGYNSFDRYTPGIKIQVLTRGGKVILEGSPTIWNNGEVHQDSGDRGWWFDFSSIKTPGEYYVYDPSTHKRSAVFKIGN